MHMIACNEEQMWDVLEFALDPYAGSWWFPSWPAISLWLRCGLLSLLSQSL